MISINVDYINLYSTCEIRGFAFLFREPARSYANGFGLRKNETASRLKSKKKLSLMAFPPSLPPPLFLEEHKPDIECLFAKTADIVGAPSNTSQSPLLGYGAKCISSSGLQGHEPTII